MSLSVSGALTGYLVVRLQQANARLQDADTQAELGREGLQLRAQINTAEQDCARRTPVAGQPQASWPCAASAQILVSTLAADPGQLNLSSGDRIVLLGRPRPRVVGDQPRVLWDSYGTIPFGTPIAIPSTAGSGEIDVPFTHTWDGVQYLAAGDRLQTRVVSWAIVARPHTDMAAQAAGQIVTPILEAGGAGLALAILVSLVLGRAFARPLRELRLAAEDIAGGNYSRRVRVVGRDEIGVVGRAFNRMAEAVEGARHQQRAFLANVSHELKTPLTSLIGFSQALMDGSLRTADEKERAATILHEEARRVLRMSQELLDLARVESGQLALNRQPVDLGVQLHQEIELVRKRAEERRLSLRLVAPAALAPVHADPDRLHQILDNLLDNAVKYAPEGTTVWISADEGPGDRVTTTVKNRLGVRPPDPRRMFDRFYRGDPSRSSPSGVGLGLAISRELALAQDGDLRAELTADGSLCMSLDLPVAARPPAPTEIPARGPVRLSPRPQLPS